MDLRILREQPFNIVSQESKLDKLAPGKDPMRLGGHGTLGEKERTTEGKGNFPDTAVDYNILSNIPFKDQRLHFQVGRWCVSEWKSAFGDVIRWVCKGLGEEKACSNPGVEPRHWARPECRPRMKEKSPRVRKVPAFLCKDFDIVTNRPLGGKHVEVTAGIWTITQRSCGKRSE